MLAGRATPSRLAALARYSSGVRGSHSSLLGFPRPMKGGESHAMRVLARPRSRGDHPLAHDFKGVAGNDDCGALGETDAK